jgi:hypothetical protein
LGVKKSKKDDVNTNEIAGGGCRIHPHRCRHNRLHAKGGRNTMDRDGVKRFFEVGYEFYPPTDGKTVNE